MNQDVLTEAELRGIYYENWREEFQNAAGGVFSAHYIRFGTRPDFEFTRHGTFQYFRWVVANRNAKLAIRPYSGDWSAGTVVDDVESAFEKWWASFPKTLEETNFYEPGQEPFYDFELWLACPQTGRYMIFWDMDSPPEKFGDKPLGYPN